MSGPPDSKYDRDNFEDTGEARCPKEGEFFETPSGYVSKAPIDFTARQFPILERVEE